MFAPAKRPVAELALVLFLGRSWSLATGSRYGGAGGGRDRHVHRRIQFDEWKMTIRNRLLNTQMADPDGMSIINQMKLLVAVVHALL